MKIGLFLPSSRGLIVSHAIEAAQPTYDYHRRVALEAEELGLDFLFTPVKLRGMGGRSRFWDDFLDSFTTIAALAEATERVQLFASVAILTMPPPLTARMCTTIDDISNGRFALNIVTGWAKDEYDQMGVWPGDHYYGIRYEVATEYVKILRELWTTGHSDFKGEHYEMKDCVLGPLPKHDILVVNAGESDRAFEFSGELCDIVFFHSRGRERIREDIEKARRVSTKYRRELTPYVVFNAVIADTDEEAQQRLALIRGGFDEVAYAAVTGLAELDKVGANTEWLLRHDDRAFMNNDILAGSPATVAAEIDDIARDLPEIGGITLVLDDYLEGTRRLGREVMPLLEVARQPVAR